MSKLSSPCVNSPVNVRAAGMYRVPGGGYTYCACREGYHLGIYHLPATPGYIPPPCYSWSLGTGSLLLVPGYWVPAPGPCCRLPAPGPCCRLPAPGLCSWPSGPCSWPSGPCSWPECQRSAGMSEKCRNVRKVQKVLKMALWAG